jgi:hypothetical protein
VVPVEVPRYSTLSPLRMMSSGSPFITAAASLDLNGSQVLYSVPSILTRSSP